MGDVVDAEQAPAEFLFLRQLGQGVTLRLSQPLDIAPEASATNLLCLSNARGLLFAATNDGFIVHKLSDVRTQIATAPKNTIPVLSPWRAIPTTSNAELGASVRFLRIANQNTTLAVGLTNGRIALWQLDELEGGADSAPQAVLQPPTTDVDLVELAPNPSDRPELCAVLYAARGQKDVRRAEVSICNVQSGQWQGKVAAPEGTSATCLSWSVKGKQLVLGLDNGGLAQVTPEGEIKKSLPKTPALDGDYYVEHVLWLENNVFVVTYNVPQATDEPEHQYEVFALLRDPANDALTSIRFDDPAPPFGDTARYGHRYVSWLRSWEPMKHMLFMANTSSTDVGLLGCSLKGAGPSAWQGLELEDTSRPALPFSSVDKGADTCPVGLELDFTAGDNVDDPLAAARGEDGKGKMDPVPILLIYTNDGVLLAYHVINTDAGAGRYTDATSANGVAKATPSADAQSNQLVSSLSNATSAPKAPKRVSFGQNTTFEAPPSSPFGSATAFGQPASIGGAKQASPFATAASAGFGAASFGSATPAFGQPASIVGAKQASPFATAATSSGFGSAAGTTTNAFSSFGSSSGGFGAFAAKAGTVGFGAPASKANEDAKPPVATTKLSFQPSPSPEASDAKPALTTSTPASFGQSSAFGSSTSSAFGSTSAFGQSASIGGTKSAFGQPASVGGAKQASPFAAAASGGFGTSAFGSATPAFGQPASIVGAKQASPFATAAASSGFGSTSNAFSGGGFGAFAATKQGFSAFPSKPSEATPKAVSPPKATTPPSTPPKSVTPLKVETPASPPRATTPPSSPPKAAMSIKAETSAYPPRATTPPSTPPKVATPIEAETPSEAASSPSASSEDASPPLSPPTATSPSKGTTPPRAVSPPLKEISTTPPKAPSPPPTPPKAATPPIVASVPTAAAKVPDAKPALIAATPSPKPFSFAQKPALGASTSSPFGSTSAFGQPASMGGAKPASPFATAARGGFGASPSGFGSASPAFGQPAPIASAKQAPSFAAPSFATPSLPQVKAATSSMPQAKAAAVPLPQTKTAEPPLPPQAKAAQPSLPQTKPASSSATAPRPKPEAQIVRETGLQGIFLQAYETMEKELEALQQNVERCASLQNRLRWPANATLDMHDLADHGKWTFGELEKKDKLAEQLAQSIRELDAQGLQTKASVREIQSEQLKVESKREEIARFLRARRDSSLRKMIKVRQLGPEHAENQAKLRKAYASLQESVEELDAHLAKTRESLLNDRLGKPQQMQAPSLDAIRRAVRNMTRTAEARLMELEEIELTLEPLYSTRGSAEVHSLAGLQALSLDSGHAEGHTDKRDFPSLGAVEDALPTLDALGKDGHAQKAYQAHRRAEDVQAIFLKARSQPVLNTRMREGADSMYGNGQRDDFKASDLNMTFARGTIRMPDERKERDTDEAGKVGFEGANHAFGNVSFSVPPTSALPAHAPAAPLSFTSFNAALPDAFDLPPESAPFAPGSSTGGFGGTPVPRSHHGPKSAGKRKTAVALPNAPSTTRSSSSDFFAAPPTSKPPPGVTPPPTKPTFSFK